MMPCSGLIKTRVGRTIVYVTMLMMIGLTGPLLRGTKANDDKPATDISAKLFDATT